METDRPRNDDDEGAAEAKLIPEWSVSADDQILFAGLAVVGVLALLLGWNAWRGGDDLPDAVSGVVPEETAAIADDLEPDAGLVAAAVTTTTTEPEPEPEPEAEPAPTTSTTAEVTTTTAPAPVIGDVQAAVSPFPGAITGSDDGDVALLTGFVANEAESLQAEGAAAAVEGISSVDNQLVVLEPAVLAAIQDAGVTEAGVAGEGTVITVRGTVNSEADRALAVEAAGAVDGVTDVVDALDLSVAADLNELPQVQFATASAEILPASFADLDAAAELLTTAGGAFIEVQGYTDVAGSANRNLQLSAARANAVRDYLVSAGVDADTLSATGFGETQQFGPDLADNRVVRFVQIDQ
ncbi:MAG: OmpA family protein [Actinomycetota bacterium]